MKIKKLHLLMITLFLLAFGKSAFPQIKVTGKVTAVSNGEALIGTNVQVKGTSTGTITDQHSNYFIDVPDENSTLIFSYMGYLTEETIVGKRLVVDIQLVESIDKLEEIVVVGYGTQKKVSVTGAISTMSAARLQESPADNITTMLSGRIAGIVARQSTGAPGQNSTSLYIRGLSTTGVNEPLVIVDGVQRSFANLDPNEIENISILKDAASASIYGVQGANGVILITTKRGGKKDKATISYNTSYSLSENTRFPKFLNGVDYAYWYNKASEMDGKQPLYNAEAIQKIKNNNDGTGTYGNTDWLDLLFEDYGHTWYHNISVNGGNEKVKYYLMGGVLNQVGTIKEVTFDRYNLRSNVDAQVTKNLSVSFDLAARQENRDRPAVDFDAEAGSNLIFQAISAKPTVPTHDSLGNVMASNIGWGNVNPVVAKEKSGYSRSKMSVFQSSMTLKYNVPYITGLNLKFLASYDKDYTYSKSWISPYKVKVFNEATGQITNQWASYCASGINELHEGFANFWRLTLQPSINYEKRFGDHGIKALVVYDQSETYYNAFGAGKKDFDLSDLQEFNLATEVIANSVTGSSTKTVRAGWAGRIDYDYKNKYLLQISSRYDGSYRFAKDKRWGFFPGVSVGYRISEENFLKKVSFVDNLKLRASIGKMGNDQTDAFKFYRYMQLADKPSVVFGNNTQLALYTSDIPNYDITWETATSYNAGLDASLWKGLWDIEFDWFYKVTRDILQSFPGVMPPSLGGNYPALVNAGVVDNRGFELVVKHSNKITKDLSYTLNGNMTFSKNKYIETDDSPNIPDYQKKIGRPMGGRLGFIAEGLFQSEEEIMNSPLLNPNVRPGDIKYKDLNGDGRITYEQDRTWIGKSEIPELVYGFTIGAAYKIFDVSVLFQGVARTDVALSGTYTYLNGIEDNTAFTRAFYNGGNAPYYMVEDSWTPENRGAKFTRLSTDYIDNNAYASTWWIRDASYLRLKNLQIGITIPKKLLSKVSIEALRIYFTGNNLYTWDKLDYLDPESPNVHSGYYPQQRTYSFGLNITF